LEFSIPFQHKYGSIRDEYWQITLPYARKCYAMRGVSLFCEEMVCTGRQLSLLQGSDIHSEVTLPPAGSDMH